MIPALDPIFEIVRIGRRNDNDNRRDRNNNNDRRGRNNNGNNRNR